MVRYFLSWTWGWTWRCGAPPRPASLNRRALMLPGTSSIANLQKTVGRLSLTHSLTHLL